MSGGGSRGHTTSPGKGLAAGAGEINALKPNENFQGRPHLEEVARIIRSTCYVVIQSVEGKTLPTENIASIHVGGIELAAEAIAALRGA